MMETVEKFEAAQSGQLLIVAALAIAILIASTSIYIYELTAPNQKTEDSSTVELALALRTSLGNAVVSALANITSGGQKKVLAENLNTLAEVYLRLHPHRPCLLNYTLLNGEGYEDGVKLFWEANGLGVSSAYAFFRLKTLEQTFNVTLSGAVNVTTSLRVEGHYTAGGNGTVKTVNLTCRVFNDGKPAKAKQITVYWRQASEVWVPVENPSVTDWGNGTYTLTFAIDTAQDAVHVSVRIVDARNIFVAANATCSQA